MPRSVSTLDHSIPCQKTSAIEEIIFYCGVHPVNSRGAEWGGCVTFVSVDCFSKPKVEPEPDSKWKPELVPVPVPVPVQVPGSMMEFDEVEVVLV